ncbi:hypothetical protein K438DRAFT_1976628 [Mycena galopus ATCC 62051]|nr:hypothetical protein K438DRAFT_1976628 [Mycena galopus ATCC 62051]
MDSLEGDSLLPLLIDALRVAIAAENFLPKINGSTITLAHLRQHLHSTAQCSLHRRLPLRHLRGPPARLPRPESKLYLARLPRAFSSHLIHLIDPLWLGA